MIEVTNLEKSYDEVKALNGVSFSVKPGEVIGLLGPNGAGKTTIMKILAGYLQPSGGSARVNGLEVMTHTEAVQEIIGYLPENAPLYPELTVQAHLKMIATLRRIPKAQRLARISAAVHAVGLEDRLTRTVGTLSKGYRQRLGLALAIIHQPRLLILDEPTNGLDPTQIIEVRHLIRKLAAHSTVMVSTHILSEVEATCDRAIIIMAGEVKADAGLAQLAATTDAILTLDGANLNSEDILTALTAMAGVQRAELTISKPQRQTFRVHGAGNRDLCPDLFQLAKSRDWNLCELRQDIQTLEAVFRQLATSQGGGL